jgi:hypothetical protein
MAGISAALMAGVYDSALMAGIKEGTRAVDGLVQGEEGVDQGE